MREMGIYTKHFPLQIKINVLVFCLNFRIIRTAGAYFSLPTLYVYISDRSFIAEVFGLIALLALFFRY